MEDRLTLSAFAVPFTITSSQPASEVNPKNLVITGRTETQVYNAINSDFMGFTKAATAADSAYAKALAKPGADQSTLASQLEAKVGQALAKLNSQLDALSYRLPFGHQNLGPVWSARVEGSAGVTDTTTKVNTPEPPDQPDDRVRLERHDRRAVGDRDGAVARAGRRQGLRQPRRDQRRLQARQGGDPAAALVSDADHLLHDR